jgi:hypothetical protein
MDIVLDKSKYHNGVQAVKDTLEGGIEKSIPVERGRSIEHSLGL